MIFLDKKQGKITPYGVYYEFTKSGWVGGSKVGTVSYPSYLHRIERR